MFAKTEKLANIHCIAFQLEMESYEYALPQVQSDRNASLFYNRTRGITGTGFQPQTALHHISWETKRISTLQMYNSRRIAQAH